MENEVTISREEYERLMRIDSTLAKVCDSLGDEFIDLTPGATHIVDLERQRVGLISANRSLRDELAELITTHTETKKFLLAGNDNCNKITSVQDKEICMLREQLSYTKDLISKLLRTELDF